MRCLVKEFTSYSYNDLYKLFEDVYSSSEGMSETFEDKYPDIDCFKKDMKSLKSLPPAVTLIAEIHEKPAAYVIIRPRTQSRLRHIGDLNMGVSHHFRGQGLGGILLQAAIDKASSDPELEIINLMVRSDNTPAIGLYEKIGFNVITTLHRDIKIGSSYFDGVMMRKFVDTQEALYNI